MILQDAYEPILPHLRLGAQTPLFIRCKDFDATRISRAVEMICGYV